MKSGECVLVYYRRLPLVVIPRGANQPIADILDAYAEEYIFDRSQLSGVILHLIENPLGERTHASGEESSMG
jgi:hypothetical protein